MKSNRVMRLLAILGALALILAACGDGDAVDTTEGEAVATTEAPETTEAPATTEAEMGPPEAGPLGAVTVAAGDPLEIRSLEATSGPASFLVLPTQRATQRPSLEFCPLNATQPPLAEAGTLNSDRATSDNRPTRHWRP